MIIYNKTWLNNLQLQNSADQLLLAGCITNDEVKAIKEKYPVGFYTPGIFIRIGLFILTFIIASFSFGLLSLIMYQAHIVDSFGWPLFLGTVCVVALVMAVKEKNHFRSGIDDALLWIAAGLLTGSFSLLIYSSNGNDTHYLAISIFIFILGLCFTLVFTDLLVCTLTAASFFAIVFYAWRNAGAFGNATMPFVMILVAALAYFLTSRLADKPKTIYYTNCIIVAQIVSLVVLYAAGNYLIVDKLNNLLNDTQTSTANVPYGFFFWGWTMLLPLLYVARGIAKKDIILLRTGGLLFAGAIYTFRTYYHILSLELALIIGGVVLLIAVYSIMRYLKTQKHGFTYADIDHDETTNSIKLESLIAAGTLGHAHKAPAEPVSRFGGGDFGGGGSGGGF
jgi:hypothetical protein